MIIRLVEKERVAYWEERIVALLKVQFRSGLTHKDLKGLYKDYDKDVVEKAIANLTTSSVAEEIPE